MDRNYWIEAAHAVWSSFWASEVEERGGSFPPGAILSELAPRLPREELLAVFNLQMEQIEAAVKAKVGDISTTCRSSFEVEMGRFVRLKADRTEYLYRLVMGCLGHGISPADDRDDLPDYLDHPCDLADSPWHDLCEEDKNMGQPVEAYVKNNGLKCPVCGSLVFGNSPDVCEDDGVTRIECYCVVCKSQWVDEYRLTGYTDLEIGVMK